MNYNYSNTFIEIPIFDGDDKPAMMCLMRIENIVAVANVRFNNDAYHCRLDLKEQLYHYGSYVYTTLTYEELKEKLGTI